MAGAHPPRRPCTSAKQSKHQSTKGICLGERVQLSTIHTRWSLLGLTKADGNTARQSNGVRVGKCCLPPLKPWSSWQHARHSQIDCQKSLRLQLCCETTHQTTPGGVKHLTSFCNSSPVRQTAAAQAHQHLCLQYQLATNLLMTSDITCWKPSPCSHS
jgi:hypothetical protein